MNKLTCLIVGVSCCACATVPALADPTVTDLSQTFHVITSAPANAPSSQSLTVDVQYTWNNTDLTPSYLNVSHELTVAQSQGAPSRRIWGISVLSKLAPSTTNKTVILHLNGAPVLNNEIYTAYCVVYGSKSSTPSPDDPVLAPDTKTEKISWA